MSIYYVSSRFNADRMATAETLSNPDSAFGLAYPLPDASADPATTFLFLADMILEEPGVKTKKGQQFEFIRARRQNGTAMSFTVPPADA